MLVVAATLIGRRVNYQQAAWLTATDRRVKFMSSVIQNILPVKCARYEEVLAQRAAQLRGEEMDKAKQF
jgi:ATP-binding cassette subfamily C (CFTR/MRP) protein 1